MRKKPELKPMSKRKHIYGPGCGSPARWLLVHPPTYERPAAPIPSGYPATTAATSEQTTATTVPWQDHSNRGCGQLIEAALANNRDLRGGARYRTNPGSVQVRTGERNVMMAAASCASSGKVAAARGSSCFSRKRASYHQKVINQRTNYFRKHV